MATRKGKLKWKSKRANRGRKGGTLVLRFYSDEELNTIAEKILGE